MTAPTSEASSDHGRGLVASGSANSAGCVPSCVPACVCMRAYVPACRAGGGPVGVVTAHGWALGMSAGLTERRQWTGEGPRRRRPARPPRAGHPVAAQRSHSRPYVLAWLQALHFDADLPGQDPAPIRGGVASLPGHSRKSSSRSARRIVIGSAVRARRSSAASAESPSCRPVQSASTSGATNTGDRRDREIAQHRPGALHVAPVAREPWRRCPASARLRSARMYCGTRPELRRPVLLASRCLARIA
jgi:hypothetical protein